MDDVTPWLEKQIVANDPAAAGMSGAVRLVEAAVALTGGGGMAFGLDLSPHRVATAPALAARIKATLDAWIAELDEDAMRAFHDVIDAQRVAHLGLALHVPPRPVAQRVLITYPVELTHCRGDAEDPIVDLATLRTYDGVVPSSGFDDVAEVYPLSEIDWLLSAQVSLRLDASAPVLVCALTLDADRPLTAAELDALRGPFSRALWGSGWSMNLEWDQPEVNDGFVSIFVAEDPIDVRVV